MWPSSWEDGYLEAWSRDFCAWDGAWALPSWLRDPTRSLSQLPLCTVGPAAISGPSDQAPASPVHPGTRLCASLKTDSVSCSEAPPGGSHGRRLRNRTWDLQVQCVSLVYSLDFGDHIPAFRRPAFHACCPVRGARASRAEPWQAAGLGEEARTHVFPGWMERGS